MSAHKSYLVPLVRALHFRGSGTVCRACLTLPGRAPVAQSRSSLTGTRQLSTTRLKTDNTSNVHAAENVARTTGQSQPPAPAERSQSLQQFLSSESLPSNMTFTSTESTKRTPRSSHTSSKSKPSPLSDTLLPMFSRNSTSSTSTSPNNDQGEPEPLPEWRLRKAAMARKLGTNTPWNPPRKISPDAQILLRSLAATHPEHFTPTLLKKHFGISYESVRRILKSKWEPSPEQLERKRRAWVERGKEIWAALSRERGVKPPKRWRVAGVGRLSREGGDLDGVPRWKEKEWRKRSGWWEREIEGKALGLKKTAQAQVKANAPEEKAA